MPGLNANRSCIIATDGLDRLSGNMLQLTITKTSNKIGKICFKVSCYSLCVDNVVFHRYNCADKMWIFELQETDFT